MLAVRSCGMSDVGRARAHNEDCYEIDPELGLYLVADGMGGHRFGEVAARVAVESIRDLVAATAGSDDTWPFDYDTRLRRHSNLLRHAVAQAHRQVLHAIRDDRRLYGMGTTVVGVYFEDDVAAVAHVGDSRAYLLRGGRLELLTDDHTWVNEQVVAGHLSERQARVHPLKNVVTRALGGEREVRVDVREVEAAPGDLYLLCSDGLTTMLDDGEIAELARRATEDAGADRLESLCRALVERANSHGGHDNVTVVAVEVTEPVAPESGASA